MQIRRLQLQRQHRHLRVCARRALVEQAQAVVPHVQKVITKQALGQLRVQLQTRTITLQQQAQQSKLHVQRWVVSIQQQIQLALMRQVIVMV